MKLIGIAGGSGAGKSTICYHLVDKYPDEFEVINLDDYQKKKTEPNLPLLNGKINWDHPNIVDWDKLIADVGKLLQGQPVNIEVWSHRSNPDYATHGKMLPRAIKPKPVMLLEGYLALYNQTLNKLYSKSFFLEVNEEVRNVRRGKNNIINDPDYVKNVLIPMHKKYVEPTKKNADLIVDVSNMSVPEAADYIRSSV